LDDADGFVGEEVGAEALDRNFLTIAPERFGEVFPGVFGVEVAKGGVETEVEGVGEAAAGEDAVVPLSGERGGIAFGTEGFG
jgi:hypothetical protein